MPSEQKWVYMFSEGDESMRNLLGGKGAGSAEMTRAGMPVPPGFTITTEACLAYFRIQGNLPEELADELTAELDRGVSGLFPGELADRIQDALSRRQGELPSGMAGQISAAMAANGMGHRRLSVRVSMSPPGVYVGFRDPTAPCPTCEIGAAGERYVRSASVCRCQR